MLLLAVLMLGVVPAATTASEAEPRSSASPDERRMELYLFSDAGRTVQCSIVSADAYDDAGKLRCDTVGMPSWQASPKPATCNLEWGNSVQLDPYELPYFGCVGDSLYNENQLPAGTVVQRGDFTCLILAPGVRCAQTGMGHGFELALDRYVPVRPTAKNLLTPRGLGKLKVGMALKKARATGYIKKGLGPCGEPVLRGKYRGYVSWRRNRLVEVSAFPGTNLNTRGGVGPGSTVGQMLQQHPDLSGPFAATTLADDGSVWVYLERSKRGVMVFVLDGVATGRAPVSVDLVRSIFTAKRWTPRKGLASGC